MALTEQHAHQLVPVGRLDEFEEGTCRIRTAGKWEIGVVRWHGSVYAVRNICPHQSAPVCLGSLGPKIVATTGTVGFLSVDDEVPVLACGWHGWEFDVRDGSPIW